MAITYSTVDYISNGQAINATNLNAPSVSLENRTTEIKRESDHTLFKADHGEENTVVVLPTTNTTTPSLLKIVSELKRNGPANTDTLVRYYRVELTEATLSIFNKATLGGRIFVKSSTIASFFSDDSAYDVLSRNLSVPGDGIYLKVPLRLYGGSDNLVGYPDTKYPDTEANSLGRTYLDTNSNTASASSLVKLPLRNKIEILGLSTTALKTAWETTDAFGDGNTYTVSIDSSSNKFDIDLNGSARTLSLLGIQGSRSTIAFIYDNTGGTGVVIETTTDTSPIYTQSTSIATTGLSFTLYNGNTSSGANITSLASSTTYNITPPDLEAQYSYIPLIRLTETSILVGDKEIDLRRIYLQDNLAQATSYELTDLYGAPIEAIEASWLEATKSHEVNLSLPNKLPDHKVTIRGHALYESSTNSIKLDLSRDPTFLAMIYKNRGNTLMLAESRLTCIADISSAGALVDLDIICYVLVKDNNAISNKLYFTDSDVNPTVIPASALSSVGSKAILGRVHASAISSITLPQAFSFSECELIVKVTSTASNTPITGGSFNVEIDFMV